MERNLNEYEFRTYLILMGHKGKENAIDMGELYRRVFGEDFQDKITDTRKLRKVITELRKRGFPVLSSMKGQNRGYYLAKTAEEINEFTKTMEKRALKTLMLICRIKKISLPQYLGQLQIRRLE